MSDRLTGTKAVITGAAGAIGMATARSFIEEGAEVFVTDYDDALVMKAVEELRSESMLSLVQGAAADVSAADAVGAMMAQAVEAMGGMSALINNAGTNARGDLVDLSPGDINRVIESCSASGGVGVARSARPRGAPRQCRDGAVRQDLADGVIVSIGNIHVPGLVDVYPVGRVEAG